MANLKEIRSRISSIGSTMQITSAMKMVSAAKLKKAQSAIEQMRPYAEKLRELMANVSLDAEGVNSAYTQNREVKNVLLVAITSNRGLAGAFNANIVKETLRSKEEDFAGKNVSILTIGKKGYDLLKRENEINKNESDLWDDFTFENSSKIAEVLMRAFKDNKFDEIRLIYNQFKNAATQVVQNEKFLPIVVEQQEEDFQGINVDYIFEPNKKEILIDLLPKTLKIQLFKALSDSYASEHGARMTAMHKATDNATDLQKELTLQYNKARQAAITNEITEIVGGADALEG
ncbi:ATP synthase F1 subunit gamma [Ornithobacterium rhinotracheale]|uniref:ATP synthase gamma chain n=1 Tax=Ornithobacterium rhinotracheale (strain ATCC 51463 / DSM 15997 / CCUG 23171 / CIP 104009 / LMG 9086) TaxID=867902 RepID=I3ZY41_ORNRL|nr:ATP synthase F1 subunit gamma [Ornithobacterium rhinotracheale]AFL96625.1 ATP synthase F1 subcomplex gamma subunit [Ornithobacterium rhinotracheale DSM 15997]AIP98792.1 F0F1 ATP synthase subunit gamma [Ornithobacterium rhinotracheale ORT-UMN 88]KGB67544.1 F0F1 ATP synthase subunit gamma [Ornithobacterium rhinotracheale H06-030791]MBN3663176.1 ATP synthase F1 subunit gamma [Ornithobacterium rhinotracheale]MCK0195243.1 ATP synthase F1 subunit gamma [Ornithobacterium rhinotracheale]